MPGQLICQLFISNKAWSNSVIMHSFLSLIVKFLCNVEVGKLSRLHKLGINFKSKCTESTIVNASSTEHILFNILTEGFEDQMELCLWIQWLHRVDSSCLWDQMPTVIVLGMRNNPESGLNIPSKDVVVIHQDFANIETYCITIFFQTNNKLIYTFNQQFEMFHL